MSAVDELTTQIRRELLEDMKRRRDGLNRGIAKLEQGMKEGK